MNFGQLNFWQLNFWQLNSGHLNFWRLSIWRLSIWQKFSFQKIRCPALKSVASFKVQYMYPYSWVQRFPRENNASCCRMSHEMLHFMINYVLNRNKFKNIHEKWEIRMTSSKGLFLARWRLCILSSIFSDYLPIFLTWNSFDCWLFWGNKL